MNKITTTIIAAPSGVDRHGRPLKTRTFVVDERREDWGAGRTRIFVLRPDLEVGDGTQRFALAVVQTDTIEAAVA